MQVTFLKLFFQESFNVELDVFNALDVMENASIFESLKFGAGDGYLQFYLYNWKCPLLEPSQVGLVLL